VLTPPNSHFDLAMHALQNGAHVLVEKPMAFRLSETMELFATAERVNCPSGVVSPGLMPRRSESCARRSSAPFRAQAML